MDITLDKKGSSEAVIKIKLSEPDYQPKVEEKIKEYRKKVQLKGFRPGKVPAGIIKRMYGKSILVEEVNQMLSQAVMEYIRNNDINIIGEPLPNLELAQGIDWGNQTDFEFEYELGLMPELSVAPESLSGVNRYTFKVSDEEINEHIESLLERHGTSSNPEVSAEGDSVFGKLLQEEGDFEKTLLVSPEHVAEGQAAQFVGLKADDIISFDLREVFPDTERLATLLYIEKEEAEGLSGTFSFTVQNINRREKAEINQELFDAVYKDADITDEAGFREETSKFLAEQYAADSQRLVNRDLRDKLVDATEVDFPADFFKRWLLQTNEGKLTEEELDKDFDQYVKEMKWNLIVNQMSKDHEIKVEYEEIREATKRLFMMQFGQMAMAPELSEQMNAMADNYLKENNGENLNRMELQARTDKVLEKVAELASFEDKEVSWEEFQKEALNS